MPLDDDEKQKWKRVQARLRASAGEDAFTSWLASLQLEEIRETIFYCSVPTSFLKHWIEKNYAKSVVECITLEWQEAAKVYVLQRTAGQRVVIPDPKKAPEKDELLGGKPKQEPMELKAPDAAAPEANHANGGASEYSSDAQDPMIDEDLDEAEELPPLQQLDPDRRIYLQDIIRYACTHYKLARRLLLSEKRGRDVVRPRQIGMFLSKHMTNRSLPEIGRQFGGRDHTTVLHSVRKIEELILNDIEFAFEVATLEATIRHRQLA